MTSLVVANAMGAKLKTKDIAFPWEQEQVEEGIPDIAEMRKKLNELKKQKI